MFPPSSKLDPSALLPALTSTGGTGVPEEVPAEPYEPTLEDTKFVEDVNGKTQKARRDRQPHEQQWFVNAAMDRGQQYVQWSDKDQRLTVPPAPSHRVRLVINRIFPKLRARVAKILKNRATPHVVPAQADQNAKMNARASEKALMYQWRRLTLESKYKDALLWAKDTSKSCWWYYWNESAMGRITQKDPLSGQSSTVEVPLGDIGIEVGSAFELLVADPGISRVNQQPWIIRIKLRDVDDVKGRYPDKAPFIKADAGDKDMFRFERQIATLNNVGYGGASSVESRSSSAKTNEAKLVLVKEYFEKPSAQFPKGRYAVIAGDVLVRNQDELPFNFYDLDNPYPVTIFTDIEIAGQFWGPTLCEQLIPLQREYNLVRSKLAEQLRMMAFPKLLVAKQHNLADGAWSSEAGEMIEYVAIPGIPPPTPWIPPNIANDAWQSINLLQREFDDVTQIYPAAEGETGTATSGFQTNLLQEATDSVHAPDVRAYELALEEAAIKIRRMMKLGYDIPRLITTIGKNYEPEILEFSQDQIDEAALIVVEASSQLPDLKGAKIQAIIELFNAGMLGDQEDPDVKRRALSMLEMGDLDQAYDYARRDEDLARIEDNDLEEGRPLAPPEFYQNHQLHYQVHTDQLKNAEVRSWPPPQKLALITHVIWHVDFMNPASALMLSQQYGIQPPPHAAQLLQQQQQQQMLLAQHPELAAQMAAQQHQGPQPAAPSGPPPGGPAHPAPHAPQHGAPPAQPPTSLQQHLPGGQGQAPAVAGPQ